jgi:hypothetical protein
MVKRGRCSRKTVRRRSTKRSSTKRSTKRGGGSMSPLSPEIVGGGMPALSPYSLAGGRRSRRRSRRGGSVLATAAVPFGLFGLQRLFRGSRSARKGVNKFSKSLRRRL